MLMSVSVNAKDIVYSTRNKAMVFFYLVVHGIHPDDRIKSIQTSYCHSLTSGMILSVIEESVLWLMSVSYISLMWFEISRKLIPRPYMPKIFFSRLSAKIVSRF